MWKNKKKILLPLAICAFLVGCGALGWFLAGRSAPAELEIPNTVAAEETAGNVPESPTDADRDMSSTVWVDGELMQFNRKLRTALFLGVDSTAKVEQNELLGNGGRADVILLLVMNTEDNTTRILSISRDTMTTVDVYDSDRRFLFSGMMQVNMQYAFSDSPARSCSLMKRNISSLLYGIPIDYCISLTMDGISAMTEWLGGLTLTIPEDWTQIDPAYSKGAVVTLSGAEAERFVRYRDLTETGSNDTRMDRHAWLVRELFSQLRHLSSDALVNLYQSLDAYICSDMDAETMKMFFTYELQEIEKIPGQTSAGSMHDEYYVDEAALKQLILQTFYVPAD